MQMNFSKTVGALTEESQTQTVQWNGKIDQIHISFPPGANSLVDVAVWHGTKQILPEKGYIALDDITPNFFFNESVSVGDHITVKWINTDNTFPHTISVIVNVMEEPTKLI